MLACTVANGRTIAFAPQVSVSNTEGCISLYNMNTDKQTHLSLPSSLEKAAEVSDYKFVASSAKPEGDDDEAENQNENASQKMGDPSKFLSPYAVTGLSFDNNGEYLVATTDSSALYVFSVNSAKLVAYKPIPRRPTLVTFSPDNRFIVFADRLGDIYAVNFQKFLNSESTDAHLLFSMGVVVTTLSFTNIDGKTYIICGDQESKVRVSHFPNFFDIQSMCMGQDTIISAMQVGTVGNKPFLITASTNPPINSSEDDNGAITAAKMNPSETKFISWDVLTGKRMASSTLVLPNKASTESGDVGVTYFSSSITVGDGSVVLFAPAHVSCGRIESSTSYVKSFDVSGSVISSLVAVNSKTCAQIPVNIVDGSSVQSKIVRLLSIDKDTFVCAFEDNTFAFVEVQVDADTLNVSLTPKSVHSVPNVSALTEVAYPDYITSVHTRLIETFYKHEFFFVSNLERKKEKILKKQKKSQDNDN